MSQKIFSVFIYLIFTIIRRSFKLMSLFSQTLDCDEFFLGERFVSLLLCPTEIKLNSQMFLINIVNILKHFKPTVTIDDIDFIHFIGFRYF